MSSKSAVCQLLIVCVSSNALDNLSARRHVNRMCLAARVPLIESGTAGYDVEEALV